MSYTYYSCIKLLRESNSRSMTIMSCFHRLIVGGPMTLIGIVISTRLMNPQLAHQRFNDPLVEFKSSATGLNESINPVINAPHLYQS